MFNAIQHSTRASRVKMDNEWGEHRHRFNLSIKVDTNSTRLNGHNQKMELKNEFHSDCVLRSEATTFSEVLFDVDDGSKLGHDDNLVVSSGHRADGSGKLQRPSVQHSDQLALS